MTLTMTQLPTDYQKCYVYNHVDPITGKPVYIGMGRKDRAWHYRVSMSRKPEHEAYLNALEEEGFLPCDWVVITHRNLTEEQAKAVEIQQIKSLKPRFNYSHNEDHCTIDKELLNKAKELKEQGIVGSKAAKLLEVSVMTTWRYQYDY